MRTILSALVIATAVAVLAPTAQAQDQGASQGQIGLRPQSERMKELDDRKRRADEVDKEYSARMKALSGGSAKAVNDPWAGVRSSEPAKVEAHPVKQQKKPRQRQD
jgi:hypothetical protein